jgi:hypothetical protein
MPYACLRSVSFSIFVCVASLFAPLSLKGQQAVVARSDTTTALGLDHEILADIKDHSEIMKNLTYLSDIIGPRLTGSPALKRANEWTAERMRSYGLSNVHLEAWAIPAAWERGTATARLVEPDNGRTLTLAAEAWTPGTPGKVTGDVVIVSATKRADLAAYKGKLKNAIVLLNPPAKIRSLKDQGWPGLWMNLPRRFGKTDPMQMGMRMFQQMMAFRQELLEVLRQEGAVAVFTDSGKPQGLLNMSGNWHGDDRSSAIAALPTLYVAHEHYALLYRLAKRPAPARTRVELEVQNKITPGPVAVYNTVGEIVGSEKPNEYVMLGAHLDSWDLGQGTTDNGTGSMVVLETARVLAHCGFRPKRTLRFILFSGEEQGLKGSLAYVKQHKDEMARISCCLVHDTGTGKVTGIGLQGRAGDKPVLERELVSLRELGPLDLNLRSMFGTDHFSFEQAGVPAFAVQQDMGEYFLSHHSQSDTLDKVHEADLVQGAQVLAVSAMRIANLKDMLPRDTK